MAHDVDNLKPPSTRRRSSKRARAVRIMVAETAWLDGRLHWQAGRVAWERQGHLMVPEPADLALAQRRLYTIRRYPISAELALGNGQAWLIYRHERLALAKRLRSARNRPDTLRRRVVRRWGDALG